MKTANILYGMLGIFGGLLGGAFAMQGLALMMAPGNSFRLGAAVLVLGGGYFLFRSVRVVGRNFGPSNIDREEEIQPHASVEDRLDELERLKRREMVTPEEYATKRQDILKDL